MEASMSGTTGKWRVLGNWLLALWRRIVASWRQPQQEPEPAPEPPPPPPPPTGPLTHRRDMDGSIQLPTRGYVFNFHLQAVFTWSSDGIPKALLSDSARRYEHLVRRDVRRIAATRTRHFAPHRVREAEVEVQRLINDAGPWRFGVDGTFVVCRPQVWLALDDRVKQHVRPHFERLIEIECAHDVEMKRAQLADRLSGQWLTVLEKLVADPLAAGAAKLTEQAFAEVVTDIKAEQKAAQDKLNELLEKMISTDSGPYEKAESFDMLREHYLRNGGQEPAARP